MVHTKCYSCSEIQIDTSDLINLSLCVIKTWLQHICAESGHILKSLSVLRYSSVEWSGTSSNWTKPSVVSDDWGAHGYVRKYRPWGKNILTPLICMLRCWRSSKDTTNLRVC